MLTEPYEQEQDHTGNRFWLEIAFWRGFWVGAAAGYTSGLILFLIYCLFRAV